MSEQGFKWAPLGGGMLDQIICDCGWESHTYFDGTEYAHSAWKKHVKESHGVQEPSPTPEAEQ